MLITGTILQVEPPDYKDNYGNQYQNITIQTQAGPMIGRKGSKTPYGTHDINRQVSWECEQKTNSRGQYNQFKIPQDPKYAQPAPSQPQQGAQQPLPQPNARNKANGQPDWDAIAEGKVRCNVICAIMSAGSDPDAVYVNKWVKYIMTGQFPPQDIPSDDVPF